jgi:hypothetical protein
VTAERSAAWIGWIGLTGDLAKPELRGLQAEETTIRINDIRQYMSYKIVGCWASFGMEVIWGFADDLSQSNREPELGVISLK